MLLQNEIFYFYVTVKCKVSDWTSWSTCSKTCGEGFRTRKRDILIMPPEGEKRCPEVVDAESCNPQKCSTRR